MTLKKAIARFDTLYPNDIDYEQKIAWISELDGIVYEEIIALHENPGPTAFTGYILETPGNTVLLVPFPYDKIYIEYLLTKTELARGNIQHYNNAYAVAAMSFDAYAAEYNRTHTPLQTAGIYF